MSKSPKRKNDLSHNTVDIAETWNWMTKSYNDDSIKINPAPNTFIDFSSKNERLKSGTGTRRGSSSNRSKSRERSQLASFVDQNQSESHSKNLNRHNNRHAQEYLEYNVRPPDEFALQYVDFEQQHELSVQEVSTNISSRHIYPHPSIATQEQIDAILTDCESYVNWVINPALMSLENLKQQIQMIKYKYVIPNEKFDQEFISKYDPLQHISNLGTLCFYHIESNEFCEAVQMIEKTRNFVLPAVKNGNLPAELIDSFDYVWVFLRISGSVQELATTHKMNYFPPIDITNVPKVFQELQPKVRAGVYGLKFYFFKLQQAACDKQIDVIQKAISHDRSNYEWHYLLFTTLRFRRKEQASKEVSSSFGSAIREEEAREVSLANKYAPDNPRCILANIQFVADFVKLLSKQGKVINFKLGDIKFQSIITVKSYLQEQASKILELCPTSVLMRTSIADIFSVSLPGPHRNHAFAKELLTTCIHQHPDSVKANHRLALFYLSVEINFAKAEEYLEKAHKVSGHSFAVLTGLIYMMMRKLSARHEEISQLIDNSLEKSFYWDKKQEGGLRYIKALALCSSTVAKAKPATDEFIKAYQCSEKALNFAELPSLHRRYGWPEWEKSGRLTFEKIRQRLLKVESAGMDVERKIILQKIIYELDTAALTDTKSLNKWKL